MQTGKRKEHFQMTLHFNSSLKPFTSHGDPAKPLNDTTLTCIIKYQMK